MRPSRLSCVRTWKNSRPRARRDDHDRPHVQELSRSTGVSSDIMSPADLRRSFKGRMIWPDFVVSAEGEPWVSVQRGTFHADIAELEKTEAT
jgi:hypothetical protein